MTIWMPIEGDRSSHSAAQFLGHLPVGPWVNAFFFTKKTMHQRPRSAPTTTTTTGPQLNTTSSTTPTATTTATATGLAHGPRETADSVKAEITSLVRQLPQALQGHSAECISSTLLGVFSADDWNPAPGTSSTNTSTPSVKRFPNKDNAAWSDYRSQFEHTAQAHVRAIQVGLQVVPEFKAAVDGHQDHRYPVAPTSF